MADETSRNKEESYDEEDEYQEYSAEQADDTIENDKVFDGVKENSVEIKEIEDEQVKEVRAPAAAPIAKYKPKPKQKPKEAAKPKEQPKKKTVKKAAPAKTTAIKKSPKKEAPKQEPKKENKKCGFWKWFWPILGIAAIIVILIIIFAKKAGETAETGKVVAIVNGEKIYESDMQAETATLSLDAQQALDQEYVLSQVIDKNLLLSEAEKAGIEVDSKVQDVLAQNGITLEELETNLVAQGVTIEDFKDQLRIYYFLNETLFKNLVVSEQEIQAFYNENKAVFAKPETVTARHILVSTETRSDEEAMTIMAEVQEKLLPNKSNFCELVTEYSEDPGSPTTCGGYPAFDKNSNFVQEYKDTAFANKVGETGIAKTQFGYHLIWTVEKTPQGTYSLEEIKLDLESGLLYEKQKAVFSQYMDELRNSSEIINCLETPDVKECGGEKQRAVENDEETEITEDEADTTVNLKAFAQCLTEKGVKMYGAYWCSHCNSQKEMFGDEWQYVTYVECSIEGNQRAQTEICSQEDISGYPTWEINGNKYPGATTLEKLSELSGCEL